MPSEIAGENVDLRQLVPAHASAIVDGIAASLPELRPWFPWAQARPTSQEQVARAIEAVRAFSAGQDFEYSLIEKSTNVLVGGLRVNPAMGPGIAEIGYWVRSDRHRRGYATEAVMQATTAAWTNLETLTHIEIHMDPTNEPSRRVAEKSGYRFDGEIDREPAAPAHTGRALVWCMPRPASGS